MTLLDWSAKLVGLTSNPHFLIIGAQKAGTTSLHALLSLHPSILPPVEKELHYFDDIKIRYGDEVSYHRKFPSKLLTASEGKVTFETTPSYLYHPECPKRIFEYSPSIKLIAVLREPVSRAYSAWRMYNSYSRADDERLRKMGDPRSFEEAITQELKKGESVGWHKDMRGYLARGMYVKQVQRYLEFFRLSDNLLIIGFEELFKSPNKVLPRVTNFLELPNFNPPDIPHSGSRSKDFPGISEPMYRRLKDFFDPLNEELFQLVGSDFSWG